MTIVCCSVCYEALLHKSVDCARVWLDLCACFVSTRGIVKLRETKVPWVIPLLKKMEKMGYILTSDGADDISIRVNGYDIIDSGDDCLETFCVNRQEHQSEEI